MGFGKSPLANIRVANSEVFGYEVPLHPFVAEHELAASTIDGSTRVHTGELEAADLANEEVVKQFRLLAKNCTDIIIFADQERKTQALGAVIETVVCLQNPQYATDQLEVHAEAHRLHRDYVERTKTLQHFVARGYAVPLEKDPSEELLEDFDEYVTGTYDLRAMRERAALTLKPLVKPVVQETFAEIAGIAPERMHEQTRTTRAIGAAASRELVSL